MMTAEKTDLHQEYQNYQDYQELQYTESQKEFYHIPSYNFPTLEEKIQKLNKKAEKLNCPQVTLTVIEKYTEEIEIKKNTSLFDIPSLDYKIPEIVTFYKIKIEGDAPQLKDWCLIASIETLQKGNLIKSIAGQEIPQTFRTKKLTCEHCNTDRKRKYHYLVKNIETQQIKIVGKTCLKDFTGHQNPVSIANFYEYMDNLLTQAESQEEGTFFNCRYEPQYKLIDILAITTATIETYSFISRKKQQETEERLYVTSDRIANYLIGRNFKWEYNKETRETNIYFIYKIKELELTITEKHKEQAKKAIEWAKNLPEEKTKNDYMYNIYILAHEETIRVKDFGLTASIIPAYYRDQEFMEKKQKQESQRQQETKNSDYIGEVKQRLDFELTIKKIFSFETEWGITKIYRFIDSKENIVVWKTTNVIMLGSGRQIEEGDKIKLKGTIKEHKEYREEKQTVITRCKLQKD